MFLLVCDSYTGSFIVTFPYMHILYLGLVHPSIISLFFHFLLEMTLTGFSVPYSYVYRKNLNHVHPPLSSSFILLLPRLLSLSHDLFHIPIFIVLVSIPCSVGFCLSVLPVNILCLNNFFLTIIFFLVLGPW
jgi:hypothetical protein